MDGPEDTIVEGKNFLHIHNKGIENRVIFAKDDDYAIFLDYIKEYVSKVKDRRDLRKSFQINGRTYLGTPHLPKNYHGKIEIVAYSFTPTSFDLIVREIAPNMLESFMRSLCTRYVIYYNKKYSHSGRLFQGPYEASYIKSEQELQTLVGQLHAKGSHTSKTAYAAGNSTSWIHTSYIPTLQPGAQESLEKNDLTSTLQGGQNRTSKKRIYAFASVAIITFMILTGWSVHNIQTTQTLGAQTSVNPTEYPVITQAPVDLISPMIEQQPRALVQVSLVDQNSRANIRAYPDSSAPIVAKAMHGDTFEYISQIDGWYEIMQPDGSRGYIAASSLKVLEPQNHD